MIKEKTKSNHRILRMKADYYKQLQKRADELDLTFSSYIRAVTFLDMKFGFFERVNTSISLDKNFAKQFDKKVLVKKENKRTKNKINAKVKTKKRVTINKKV